MKKFIYLYIVLLISSCQLFQTENSNIVRIKGSDTMLLLNKRLAAEFMKEFDGISIYVDGGGTSIGVNALIGGSVDICAASRPLEPLEIQQMGEKFGTVGMSFLVARDALSIYVNHDNPIKNLTTSQIADIYTCKIKNWNELGGRNSPIQPRSRNEASGTNLYFVKHVLKGDTICSKIPSVRTTREIISFVQKNKNSIGYGGVGYADSLIQCAVNGIKPTRENVLNNHYPISRYLRFYTSKKPKGNVKLFIDWVTSKKGQKIVESIGYIPLWS